MIQQSIVGGAQVAEGNGQGQLFALVAELVAELEHPGAAVERGAGNVQRVAAIGHFRVNDHIEAVDAMGLGAAQGGANAGHGVIQGAAQLEGGIGADDAGAGDNFQQTGGRAGAGQGGVTVRRRAGGLRVRGGGRPGRCPASRFHRASNLRVRRPWPGCFPDSPAGPAAGRRQGRECRRQRCDVRE